MHSLHIIVIIMGSNNLVGVVSESQSIFLNWYQTGEPLDLVERPSIPTDKLSYVTAPGPKVTTTTVFEESWVPSRRRLLSKIVMRDANKFVAISLCAIAVVFFLLYIAASLCGGERSGSNRIVPMMRIEPPLTNYINRMENGESSKSKEVGRGEGRNNNMEASNHSCSYYSSYSDSGPSSEPSSHSSDEIAAEVVRWSGGIGGPGYPVPLVQPVEDYVPMSYRTPSQLDVVSNSNFFTAVKSYDNRRKKAVEERLKWKRQRDENKRRGLTDNNQDMDNI